MGAGVVQRAGAGDGRMDVSASVRQRHAIPQPQYGAQLLRGRVVGERARHNAERVPAVHLPDQPEFSDRHRRAAAERHRNQPGRVGRPRGEAEQLHQCCGVLDGAGVYLRKPEPEYRVPRAGRRRLRPVGVQGRGGEGALQGGVPGGSAECVQYAAVREPEYSVRKLEFRQVGLPDEHAARAATGATIQILGAWACSNASAPKVDPFTFSPLQSCVGKCTESAMGTDTTLKTRHQEILTSVVREYIETGEPVGSRTLSKHRNEPLSPASIRNVMADLADEGYLSQPHTSAGRVPTEKAFRFYVKSIVADRMAPVDASK